jgi:hypothetical protein
MEEATISCPSLHHCDYNNFTSLKKFEIHSNQLEELNLSKCKSITALIVDCPNLKIADFSQETYSAALNDILLQNLCKSAPLLQKLNLRYNFNVTGTTISLPHLQSLQCRQCIGITAEGLEHILKVSSKIQLVDISECKKVTKEQVERLSTVYPNVNIVHKVSYSRNTFM